MNKNKKLDRESIVYFLTNNALYMIIAVLIIIIASIDFSFFNIRSFTTILSQASTRIIFALGVGGIIVLGGTDLSLGRNIGLTGVLAASMLQATDYYMKVFEWSPLPVIIPLIMAMTVCATLLFLHGSVVAHFGVAPFIASLGFQQIIYGMCSLYYNSVCGANPLSNFSPGYVKFTQGTIKVNADFSVPYVMFYALVIILIMWFVWNRTVLGKHMFAVGGNKEAARVSGVKVKKTMIIIYVIAGLLYGLGGVLEAGRTGSAVSTLGQGYEMDAIAACVVGGVSMRGGTGSVQGIVLGVIIFQIISYGLIYIGISPDIQYIVKGLIILVAVIIDTRKYMLRSK